MNTEARPLRGRHIGVISYDFDPPIGGLGVLVRTYVDELKKLYPNDTYTVVSPSANADEKGPRIGYSRYRKSGGCPLFSLSLFFSLPSLIRTHGFDLVHVHSGSGGVFLLRRPRCKLVVTAHHTYRQEADLVFASSPFKRLWKLFMALFEARTYRLADMVICVSRDTADEIIAQYGVPASRVCVIENPVRVSGADSLRTLPKNQNTILFVGRLEARKGILLLLKAFQLLLKEMPTAKLRLVGFNLLGTKLESIIASRGLKNSVTVLGYVHDPYRFRETAEAAVMIVPSSLEGFGLVAAEAMTLGTCVIASDAPGLRSVIANGRTGISFPVGDVRACADAMKLALTDTKYREKLEREALMEAPIRFNVEKRSRDVGDVFARVLGK
ncbi:MAG: glycosyltransferase family 4 protein [Candidatus Peribacteraceae bacterium]|nr:glycosyltransferase family 4 protein [Candidatus Peribacteraceae bacterium]